MNAKITMNQVRAALGVLTLGTACLGVACGGKVIFDEPTGGAPSTASPTAVVGATTTHGVQSSTSASTGTCDASIHTIGPDEYDDSCVMASDCSPAFIGNFCGGCLCPNAGINVAQLAEYQAEAMQKNTGEPPGCNCPVNHQECTAGHCTIHVP